MSSNAGKLVVDTDLLRAAGARLADLAQTFSAANVTARDLRADVGHDGLADVLGEFAIGWDDVRTSVVADVGALAEACTRVGTTFAELDTAFAAQLRGTA
ncbi:hypothetical protein AB6N23_03845 [Cellulomonas sp. 179-A 9B4 NHS]|uniref:hypothetical protein n=1 Tax=Cellulomonas sp. 179-A 9B4 NHS TaxID=3142379 RepID=UPI00399FE338